MEDDEITQPLPIVYPRATRLYGYLLIVQRRLNVMRERYSQRRRVLYDALRDFMAAESELDALTREREQLNKAHIEAVQREAGFQLEEDLREDSEPPETREERWGREYESKWSRD